jgi:hypothetical protein
MSHNFELKTNLDIITRDLDGNLISIDRVHNLVVSTGLDLIRNHLLSTMTELPPNHFCLGWWIDTRRVNGRHPAEHPV